MISLAGLEPWPPGSTVVAVCLANLALIGVLPRIFFRKGRLNARWWATAGPFFLAGAALLLGSVGVLEPHGTPWPVLREALASLVAMASIAGVAYTLGTHQRPLPLWHQSDDMPEELVTTGAYARVRHPFYASFILALAATALALPHPITLATLFAGYLQLDRTAAREEKRLLASEFGARYRGYFGATRRFVPLPIRTRRPGPIGSIADA